MAGVLPGSRSFLFPDRERGLWELLIAEGGWLICPRAERSEHLEDLGGVARSEGQRPGNKPARGKRGTSAALGFRNENDPSPEGARQRVTPKSLSRDGRFLFRPFGAGPLFIR